MKKLYGLIILYFTASIFSSAFADSTSYGKVLYRINAGGWQINSKDTSNVNWMEDDTYAPYVDTLMMGNKTFGVYDSVGFDPSVPPTTPFLIFRTERDLGLP